MKRIIAFALIIAGLVIGAMSCFDKGIETVDPETGQSQLTQKVCSDYPQNARPADCLNTEDTLNRNGGIDHPVAFATGVLILCAGLFLLMHGAKGGQPHTGEAGRRIEWKCRVDGHWNPVSTAMCQVCGNGRVGIDEVRGNEPGDVWPNAPFTKDAA